eukprot:2813950-Pleurochrysis_carterae.AAC.2
MAVDPVLADPDIGHGSHALPELVMEVNVGHVLAVVLVHLRLHPLEVVAAGDHARCCRHEEQGHLAIVASCRHVHLTATNRKLLHVGRMLAAALSTLPTGFIALALDLIDHSHELRLWEALCASLHVHDAENRVTEQLEGARDRAKP